MSEQPVEHPRSELPIGTSEASESANSKAIDYVGGASWGVSFVSIGALIGLSLLNHFAGESYWIVPLFALPLLGQAIGSVVLFHRPRGDKKLKTFHRFYLWTMILCIWSYHFLWACYIGWKFKIVTGSLRSLSAVALGGITVLVGLVIVMTLAIMCPPVSPNNLHAGVVRRNFSRLVRHIMGILHNLKSGASQEPFLALLLFFTVFLGVSYLFGFAFAFHDKSLGHALYMRTSYLPKEKNASKRSPSTVFRFQFDSLQAIPDIESNPPEFQGAETQIKKVAERKSNNYKNLEAIVAYIKEVRADDALRITVVGHADDDPTSGTPYLSNYELSEARAQNVRRKIVERLVSEDSNRWRNIEWFCLSTSNELEARGLQEIVKADSGPKKSQGRHHETKGNANKVSQEAKRFAEVQIEQPWNQSTSVEMERFENDRPKDIDLMDYIYFANYTITTTGYGDIIPLTPYSKFICSLANICEVFFLVVFFNSLLSLRGRGDPRAD
jgi:hypothetical protein